MSAGAIGVAGAAAVPLIKQAARQFSKKWHDYSDPDLRDFEAFREAYRQYCKTTPPVDMLLQKRGGNKAGGSAAECSNSETEKGSLPIYLSINPENSKRPLAHTATSGGFVSCLDSRAWNSLLTNGDLRLLLSECISRICECQANKKPRNYTYDPTNLFFEECKAWFVMLSTYSMNQDPLNTLLPLICERIDYLKGVKGDINLFESVLFLNTGRSAQQNIRSVLNDLIIELEGKVKVIVIEAASRRSARDHCADLRLGIEGAMDALMQIMHYLPRNGMKAHASSNFIRAKIANGSQKPRTLLDRITREVLCDETVRGASPFRRGEVSATANRPDADVLAILNAESGRPKLDAIQAMPVSESGMLPEFQTIENLEKQSHCCKNIRQLALVYQIVDTLFGLAGDGGDLLLYKQAADLMRPLIDQLSVFFTAVQDDATALFEVADTLYNDKFIEVGAEKGRGREYEQWGKTYLPIARLQFKRLMSDMGSCLCRMGEMREALNKVNKPGYMQTVMDQVTNLRGLVCAFNLSLQPGLPLVAPAEMNRPHGVLPLRPPPPPPPSSQQLALVSGLGVFASQLSSPKTSSNDTDDACVGGGGERPRSVTKGVFNLEKYRELLSSDFFSAIESLINVGCAREIIRETFKAEMNKAVSPDLFLAFADYMYCRGTWTEEEGKEMAVMLDCLLLIRPSNREALWMRSQLYMREKRYDKAIEGLEQILKESEHDMEVADTLDACLQMQAFQAEQSSPASHSPQAAETPGATSRPPTLSL